jgi:hypothetical protein
MPAAAGRLMQAELEALSKALQTPEKPVAAVVGGAKVSTKLDLLGNMVSRVDYLIIGGGMANTFLFAQGVQVGKSLCEKEMADTARAIMEKAKAAGCHIVLPIDVVVASEFAENAPNKVVPVNAVPADMMILDAGPATAEAIVDRLNGCKTLVWNGPMGAFEIAPFDMATNAVARAAAERTKQGKLLTVGGGGDTVSALAKAGVEEKFSYISTAGGAFLEWLEGKVLPGVAALEIKPSPGGCGCGGGGGGNGGTGGGCGLHCCQHQGGSCCGGSNIRVRDVAARGCRRLRLRLAGTAAAAAASAAHVDRSWRRRGHLARDVCGTARRRRAVDDCSSGDAVGFCDDDDDGNFDVIGGGDGGCGPHLDADPGELRNYCLYGSLRGKGHGRGGKALRSARSAQAAPAGARRCGGGSAPRARGSGGGGGGGSRREW